MSLQAWYPLDGNIKNYGVGQLNLTTTTTPAYVNDGKISAKALSTGGVKWTAAQTATVLNNKELSIAFWIKPLNTTSGQIFGTSGMSTNNNRKFSIFAYPNGNDLHLSWMNDAASTTFIGGVWSGVFPVGKWTHCCITYNNPTVKIYINGVLKSTSSGVSNSSSFSYETQVIHSSANRYINDFRVYNHCLTPREVKMISQGLILHLPLKEGCVEGTTNLAPYPTPGSNIATARGWDSSLHTKAISVTGWGDGYNSGVKTNNVTAEVGYHAHWQIIDGVATMVFPNLNSQYNAKNRWLGISGASGLQDEIGANGTYTVSFYAKSSVDNMIIRSGFYYRLTGASGNDFHDGLKDFSVSTSWKRYSYTCTTKANINTSHSASFYFYGHIGSVEGTIYVRNVQIELKNHATAYTKNSRTSSIMDCTGYQRHGEVVGTLTTSTDSPKYDNCIYISDGRTNYGKSGTFKMPTDQVTMSCWIKSAAIGYNSYHIPLSFNGSNYEFSIDSSGYFRNGFNINGTRSVLTTNHTSILDNKWHMITATYDGNVIRRYVDGKELTSYATSITGTLAGGSGNLLIGNYNGTQYGNKEMFMSDVRIYSTALNADDILILYQGTISLLENGGITAYEYKENSPLIKMTSTGLLRMDNISEIGYLNRMKTKVLPDGSAWARIFYHKNKGGTVLFSTYDEVMNTDTEYKYSNLYLLDHFISNDGKFEFLLNYTPVDITINYSNKYNRWKQSLNPCNEYAGTADGSLKATGYEAVHIDFSSNYWGGLTRQNSSTTSISSCFLSGSVGHSNWFYSIGAKSAWNGGIPGPDVAVEETELWVRIDDLSTLNTISMLDNKYVQALNIYEM